MAMFHAVTTHFELDEDPAWTPAQCQLVYDKIKANSYTHTYGYSGKRARSVALYEAASMINHSSNPNVAFNELNTDEVQIIRDVAQCEQLFTSYVGDPKVLPEIWGFACTCELCTRQDDDVDEFELSMERLEVRSGNVPPEKLDHIRKRIYRDMRFATMVNEHNPSPHSQQKMLEAIEMWIDHPATQESARKLASGVH